MTSSSIWNAALSTQQGRLNSASSWTARKQDQNQWIQIDLGEEEIITAIATQGRSNYNQWVKTYSVSYSLDGKTFESCKINGAVKVRIVAIEHIKGCTLQTRSASLLLHSRLLTICATELI
jgi:hypothetical protein